MAGRGFRADGGEVCVVLDEVVLEGESRCWMMVLLTAYLYCGDDGACVRREERIVFCCDV